MAKSKTASTKASTKTTAKKSSKAKNTVEPMVQPPPVRRELAAVVFLFLGIFCILSYFNTDGEFVAYFSNLLRGLLGWGFWIVAPVFLLTAFILGFHHGRPVAFRVFSALMLPVLFAAMGNLINYSLSPGAFDLQKVTGKLFVEGQAMNSGGVIGGLLALGLEKAFSTYGALPLLLLGFVYFLIRSLNSSVSGLAGRFSERPKYDPSMYDEPQQPSTAAAAKERRKSKNETLPVTDYGGGYSLDIPVGNVEYDFPITPVVSFDGSGNSTQKTKPRKKAPEAEPGTPEPKRAKSSAGIDVGDNFIELPLSGDSPVAPVTPIFAPAPEADTAKGKKKARKAEVDKEAKAVAAAVSKAEEGSDDQYSFPPLDLLRTGVTTSGDSKEEILLNKERLEGAIRSFGINAGIVSVTRGPTVTRYDIELERGVKLARVTNLAGDLALALGVINVRIAPIPNKISTVGIEVPNKIISTVYLHDMLESQRFSSAKSKLSFALGKDIGGDCIVGDISKLPHLLIAGTTGSGKSVCMNSLILSILYKARPDEVRLIMIDPKMVELGVYNGIPHLYVPVVTDPKKAAGALQWSVVEMRKRYTLFSEIGVRDIENYNKHRRAEGEPTMPRVVIVIDELADLMMVASKEVEESIVRVAQMGRAAGMHLVIATQRPSADVITGLMKANIPSRIAFAVSSAMESRIILDNGGAEKLIGMGDMLYSPIGCGKPTRIQGAFVSDEEREDVIQFIKEGSLDTQENSEIEEFMNKAASKDSGDGDKPSKNDGPAGDFDEMLPQAVEAVLDMKSCSVSMLQRRIKLGYSRAARIVDQMEELGIVGPYEGAKPRNVIIDRNGWHDIQIQLGLIPDDGMELARELGDDTDYFES